MKLKILSFLALTVFLIASCEKGADMDKEEIDKDEITKNEKEDEWGDKDKEDCFDFVYPITYIMPDGYAISGDNEESIDAEIKTWYEDNPSVDGEPSLQFPAQIVYPDKDVPVTINDEEELEKVWKDCEGEGDWDDKDDKDCFKLIYPVTYTMPDGSTISGSEEELEVAIKEWYENNDSDEKPTLNYPIQVAFLDSDVPVTVNSEDEMTKLKKEKCGDDKWDDEKEDCFKLIYPLTYTMPDGSTVSGGEEELEVAIKEWYENNDSDEKPTLNYPIQIAYPDNDVPVTINNEEELEAAKEDC